ncbi:hypothetical protein HMPREF9710_00441 [Massilia timonae CCUG 45783]|uniref:Uncharacterized protein n=1 Tax=Massilia timonae CCUG 45783 TaxID=883126 RepID=K9E082_9BURK|nr:hypothetical protein HMPREF9710_00441 [Massilia timonae CCUG 45783]
MQPPSLVSSLRTTSWRDLAGWGLAALFLVSIARTLAPDAAKPFLRSLGLSLPLLLLMAKDIAHAPDAWQRLRSAHAARAPWHARVTALLPPELVGMLRLDRLLWIGCFRRLRRQTAACTLPDGVALTYLERGAYGTATAVVFVSLLLELPVHVLLLNLFVEDAGKLALLHVLGAVAVLYTLAWVLGDRWHIGAGRHVMTDDALHLSVGARVEGVLPLAAVARLERVDAPLPIWRRRHGVASRDTLLVTPFDKPNCVLVLADDARIDILHWQARKRLPRYVFLYLDRPELLAARLRRRDDA